MAKTNTGTLIFVVLSLLVLQVVCQTENKNGSDTVESCQCMEYWDCTVRRGQPYSYCGLSETTVCCFFDPEQEEDLVAKPPFVLVPAVPEPECGKQVTGEAKLDSTSQFGEWPWHVAILEANDDLYICGGSLISSHLVVTAAHCVERFSRRSAPRLKIRAGEYDISTNDEPAPHVEVIVDMIGIHPEFNSTTLKNDIAVIGITKALNFTSNIQPVCLPLAGRTPAGQCVVTGWGRSTEIGTDYSIVLKEVVVPLWENERCERRLQRRFSSAYRLASSAFCADDGSHPNAHVCDGDGGGPLVCFDENKKTWIQEGIVSFGLGCGRRNTPGVYTKLSSFVEWIQKFK